MNWHDHVDRLTLSTSAEAVSVYVALDLVVLGLDREPAASRLDASAAGMAADLAMAELHDLGVRAEPVEADDGRVSPEDVVAVLRWAEIHLRACDGDPEHLLGYARAGIHLREALTALVDV